MRSLNTVWELQCAHLPMRISVCTNLPTKYSHFNSRPRLPAAGTDRSGAARAARACPRHPALRTSYLTSPSASSPHPAVAGPPIRTQPAARAASPPVAHPTLTAHGGERRRGAALCTSPPVQPDEQRRASGGAASHGGAGAVRPVCTVWPLCAVRPVCAVWPLGAVRPVCAPPPPDHCTVSAPGGGTGLGDASGVVRSDPLSRRHCPSGPARSGDASVTALADDPGADSEVFTAGGSGPVSMATTDGFSRGDAEVSMATVAAGDVSPAASIEVSVATGSLAWNKGILLARVNPINR